MIKVGNNITFRLSLLSAMEREAHLETETKTDRNMVTDTRQRLGGRRRVQRRDPKRRRPGREEPRPAERDRDRGKE